MIGVTQIDGYRTTRPNNDTAAIALLCQSPQPVTHRSLLHRLRGMRSRRVGLRRWAVGTGASTSWRAEARHPRLWCSNLARHDGEGPVPSPRHPNLTRMGPAPAMMWRHDPIHHRLGRLVSAGQSSEEGNRIAPGHRSNALAGLTRTETSWSDQTHSPVADAGAIEPADCRRPVDDRTCKPSRVVRGRHV